FYHPVCLGFRTALWKRSRFSFEERWPDWDVAGALTEALGGLRDEALLPRTRSAGPAQRSTRAGKVHHYGEVYAEAFTNTYGMSRKVADPAKEDFEGWSRRELIAYHRRWQRWVADVIEGRATVTDFPA
ncbi:MAG: hypothetical protein M3N52_11115, partial [Actinomycetota bacterium]|nr:hypothetical protein [Actinomycetota bacterium]